MTVQKEHEWLRLRHDNKLNASYVFTLLNDKGDFLFFFLYKKKQFYSQVVIMYAKHIVVFSTISFYTICDLRYHFSNRTVKGKFMFSVKWPHKTKRLFTILHMNTHL